MARPGAPLGWTTRISTLEDVEQLLGILWRRGEDPKEDLLWWNLSWTSVREPKVLPAELL